MTSSSHHSVRTLSALSSLLLITHIACFYLIRERTGFEETDTLVMCLVKCSIESVLGPTIVALVNLILSNLATNNQWFLFPNFAVRPRLYGLRLTRFRPWLLAISRLRSLALVLRKCPDSPRPGQPTLNHLNIQQTLEQQQILHQRWQCAPEQIRASAPSSRSSVPSLLSLPRTNLRCRTAPSVRQMRSWAWCARIPRRNVFRDRSLCTC